MSTTRRLHINCNFCVAELVLPGGNTKRGRKAARQQGWRSKRRPGFNDPTKTTDRIDFCPDCWGTKGLGGKLRRVREALGKSIPGPTDIGSVPLPARLRQTELSTQEAQRVVRSLRDEADTWSERLPPKALRDSEIAEELNDCINRLGEIEDTLGGIDWAVKFPVG